MGTVLVAFPPLLQNPWQKEFSGALLRLQLEGDMDHGAEGLGDCEAIGHTVSGYSRDSCQWLAHFLLFSFLSFFPFIHSRM